MSLMVACAAPSFERQRDLIEALSGAVFRLGERPGDGARMKLVNNLLAGINLAGAAEVLALAERAGLDPALALDVIERSSGQSWIASTACAAPSPATRATRPHHALEQGHAPRAGDGAAPGPATPVGEHAAALFACLRRLRGARRRQPVRAATPALAGPGAASPPGSACAGRKAQRARAGRRRRRPVAQARAVAQVGVFQLDLRAVLHGNLAHDRRGPGRCRRRPCRGRGRRLEDALAFARRDAGAESSTCSTTTWPNGSSTMRTVTVPPAGVYCSALSTRLRISSQQRIAADQRAGCRARRRSPAFVAEVDAFSSARGTKSHRLGGQPRQVDGWWVAPAVPGSRARHRQQLVDHVRRALAGVGDLLQRLLQLSGRRWPRRSRAAPARPACAAGQRRLQLVRGVGQEVLLRGDRLVRAAPAGR